MSTHIPRLLPPLPYYAVVHDNACGTGAVTHAILNAYPTANVCATDIHPEMVDIMRESREANPVWKANVSHVSLMDAHDLGFRSGIFDASILNFSIFFLHSPQEAVMEMYRTLKPGGSAVVTCWKKMGFLPVLWEVQERINPQRRVTELPLLDRWMDGTLLERTMRISGFNDVRMERVVEVMWGSSIENLQSCLVENFRAVVGETWGTEETARLREVTGEVLEKERWRFCYDDKGRVGVAMVAWVAICRKPLERRKAVMVDEVTQEGREEEEAKKKMKTMTTVTENTVEEAVAEEKAKMKTSPVQAAQDLSKKAAAEEDAKTKTPPMQATQNATKKEEVEEGEKTKKSSEEATPKVPQRTEQEEEERRRRKKRSPVDGTPKAIKEAAENSAPKAAAETSPYIPRGRSRSQAPLPRSLLEPSAQRTREPSQPRRERSAGAGLRSRVTSPAGIGLAR